MSRKLTKYIREEFEKLISEKTGWGKNEVMNVFDMAVNEALSRLIEDLQHEKEVQL